jgi:hypothetical protein
MVVASVEDAQLSSLALAALDDDAAATPVTAAVNGLEYSGDTSHPTGRAVVVTTMAVEAVIDDRTVPVLIGKV